MIDTSVEKGHNEKGVEGEYHEDLDERHDGVGNEHAFKGDDSDGQVAWTPKQMIAAASLGCLYAGMLPSELIFHGSLIPFKGPK
jgi:hypothetical protein